MKCACGNPNCKNEVWADSASRILVAGKEIKLNGNTAHEEVLIYLDIETIDYLVKELLETKKLLQEGDRNAN